MSLYTAMLRFDLERQEGRLREFPVVTKVLAEGVTAVALDVRNSTSLPSRPRTKGEPASGATQAAPAQQNGEE